MKNTKLLRLVGIMAGGVLLLVAFFLFFAPFLSWNEGIVTLTITGYKLTFGDGAVAGITTAWVFSLLLAITAFGAICLFLLDLAGIFKLKALDNKMLRFGLAGCVCVFALVTGILLFCVQPLAGAQSGIAAGAIVAAILNILGGALLCSGIALPAMKK